MKSFTPDFFWVHHDIKNTEQVQLFWYKLG